MKLVGFISVCLTGILLMYAVVDFPVWGDPKSPANSYLSTHYITKVEEETTVPNIVTAVLADYRSFDTMLETSVVFVAGIAIFAILRSSTPRRSKAKKSKKKGRKGKAAPKLDEDTLTHFPLNSGSEGDPDLIVRTTSRILLPPIQLFALYVIGHGHHSPGGGFQGGVMLAAGYILLALSYGLKPTLKMLSERRGIIFGNLGVLIFAGTGVVCLFFGVNFLDYSVLHVIYPATDTAPAARSHSMLVVEIGVAFTVMSMLYLIFANLASHGDLKKGL